MKSRNGFTLVELIVAMAVGILIMSYGMVRYVEFQRNEGARQVGENLISDFRLAQAYADKGVKPAGCGFLVGYQVILVDKFTYHIQALCDDPAVATGAPIVRKMPSGHSIFQTFDVTFYALNNGVDAAEQTIVVTNTIHDFVTKSLIPDNTRWFEMCIGSIGDIHTCDMEIGGVADVALSCVCT